MNNLELKEVFSAGDKLNQALNAEEMNLLRGGLDSSGGGKGCSNGGGCSNGSGCERGGQNDIDETGDTPKGKERTSAWS